jgi:hypothetical protein
MHDVFAGLSSQIPLPACGARTGMRAANARATKITTTKTT